MTDYPWIPSTSGKFQKIYSEKAPLLIKVDEASSTITYIGYANIGSTSAQDVWQIYRINTGIIAADITFADDSKLFNKAWKDRATYSY